MQLELDLRVPKPKTFVVGCRVAGEAGTQVYHITAMNHRQATNIVKDSIEGAAPVLTLVKGRT